jgi:hypothetical protein
MIEVFRRGVEEVFRPRDVPFYDHENEVTRVLYWRDEPIKTWVREAGNQELILLVFEEQDWQKVIYDPLPYDPELESKDRLHEAVKSLNKRLKPGTIRFFTTGMGTAVGWTPVSPNGEAHHPTITPGQSSEGRGTLIPQHKNKKTPRP